MIYFKNDTIADLLYAAQMSHQQSCPMLKGVVITMIGTTREEDGCKETHKVPIDKIAVKQLISQANNNISGQLIYLFTDDGELTDGNTIVEKNLSLRQQGCILSQRNVVLLMPRGTNTDNVLTPASLHATLMAEYMHNDHDNGDNPSQMNMIFSVTPDVDTLIKVVHHFIEANDWTRAGLLYDDAGIGLGKKFINEVRFTLQVHALRYDGSNANEVYSQFKNKNVRVIIFSGSVQNYLQALDDLYDYYYTGIG